MTRLQQGIDQSRADRAGSAGDQHPQAAPTRWWARALLSGSIASVLSTAVLSVLSRRRTGAASSATNATSHWLWGARAQRADAASWRHTATGYAIHHASSVFWALGFERAIAGQRSARRIGAAAAGIAALAYAVDYGVVPRRLTPGFEARLPGRDLAAVYVAFAGGLAVAGWARQARRRRGPGRPPRR